jgi:hypothetical protein
VPGQRALGMQQGEQHLSILHGTALRYLVAQVGEKISGDYIKDRRI